ncbi:MAG: hypothetical protein QXW83_04435 [Nitrososphaerales archaeon]
MLYEFIASYLNEVDQSIEFTITLGEAPAPPKAPSLLPIGLGIVAVIGAFLAYAVTRKKKK